MDILIKRRRKKPLVERVKVLLHPVKCSCGEVFYVTPGVMGKDEDRCPDCGNAPRPGQVGALEECEIDVPIVFAGGRGVVPPRSR